MFPELRLPRVPKAPEVFTDSPAFPVRLSIEDGWQRYFDLNTEILKKHEATLPEGQELTVLYPSLLGPITVERFVFVRPNLVLVVGTDQSAVPVSITVHIEAFSLIYRITKAASSEPQKRRPIGFTVE